jgi:hypothetical protein
MFLVRFTGDSAVSTVWVKEKKVDSRGLLFKYQSILPNHIFTNELDSAPLYLFLLTNGLRL